MPAAVQSAGGNQTYDGRHRYTFDAWNRLAKVYRAYRNSGGALADGSLVATIQYDGLGRRIVQRIGDGDPASDVCGDWEATYHYYYPSRERESSMQRMIESRGRQHHVLQQHVWGQQYVDELVQVGINLQPLGQRPTARQAARGREGKRAKAIAEFGMRNAE